MKNPLLFPWFVIKHFSEADPGPLFCHALIGTGASFLGVLSSFQEDVEWSIRIATSSVGFLIAVLTLCSMVHKGLLTLRKHMEEKQEDHQDHY